MKTVHVVYLKDWEQHKDLVAVLPSHAEAQTLCNILNNKCETAIGMDFDEIMDFAKDNYLPIDKSMIRQVKNMGSYFCTNEVEFKETISYGIFDASWDTTLYDWCSSDYVPIIDEYDLDDVYFDENLGCYYDLDLKHINQHKLEKFATGNNTFKRYDPKFIHPDVAHRIAYYDPIHDFCHNKGFRNANNKIERMVAKFAKNGGSAASTIVFKIKNCSDYKHNHTFRNAAQRYIEALENPYGYEWISNWEWCMSNYVYRDGHVMDKENARKYWGYEEICDICGKDHGK
ncbi:hypothetical protein Acj9p126 [Acinetobacter phage Acj9]|uniref:Uncharacterized protein n=1 Tax=Acinetobacter phage Acj9 TaxID=760939 RepID=E5EPR0_9CAUD|nr:hypothetical protein Acj9p126 [Acinetobacter phage Acj9]ADG60026.1 hypothetical protein Acj9p126 [Acinetobacter phage Acj9]